MCGPGMRVLEIGAGTGYNAGLLAHLVGPGGSGGERRPRRRGRRRGPSSTCARPASTTCGWCAATAGSAPPTPGRSIGSMLDRRRVGDLAALVRAAAPRRRARHAALAATRRCRSASRSSATTPGCAARALCGCGFMRLRGPHAGPDAHVPWFPGWARSRRGCRPTSASGSPPSTTRLPSGSRNCAHLLRGPVYGGAAAAARGRAGRPRLALEEPDAIALSGRNTWWQLRGRACSRPTPKPGRVRRGQDRVVRRDRGCAERLRAVSPSSRRCTLGDLDIRRRAAPGRAPAGRVGARPPPLRPRRARPPTEHRSPVRRAGRGGSAGLAGGVEVEVLLHRAEPSASCRVRTPTSACCTRLRTPPCPRWMKGVSKPHSLYSKHCSSSSKSKRARETGRPGRRRSSARRRAPSSARAGRSTVELAAGRPR